MRIEITEFQDRKNPKGKIVEYTWEQLVEKLKHPVITDELFADPGCHCESAPSQSVFSLAVHPDHQRRGYGRLLLDELIAQARRERRKAVTLTCREHKIAYYESFGFRNHGIAGSVHGGVAWYDMILDL